MTQEQLTAIAEAAVKSAQTADAGERKEIFEKSFANAPHNTPEAKAKVGQFFKALVTRDEVALKDLSSGVDANGGYLTPLEFSGMLIEKMYKLPVIRSRATRIPMSSDKMEIPVETATPTVNWTAELATITQSDPTFTNFTLAANELIGISRMSRQILVDSAIQYSLVDWIVSRFAAAIGRVEDAAFMTGSGTGQPKGIRQYTFTQTLAQAGASLTGDDLINLVYALPVQYRANACFLMNDKIAALVRKLKDVDGQYLWVETYGRGLNEATSGNTASLLGYPVLIQNDIPTNLGAGTNASEVYFGDLSYYVIGDREQMFSEVSTEEGTSFEKHRAAVKVGERLDAQLSLTEAFAQLTAVK